MQHNGRTPDRCEKQWQFHLHANVGGPESGGISTQWEYNPLRWVTLSPYLWMKKGESGEGMYLENAACHDVHPQRLRSHCRIISLLQLIRLVSSLIWQSDWRYPISIHPLNKKEEKVGRKENALLVRRHPRLNDSKFPLSLSLSLVLHEGTTKKMKSSASHHLTHRRVHPGIKLLGKLPGNARITIMTKSRCVCTLHVYGLYRLAS